MKTTLSTEALDAVSQKIKLVSDQVASRFPGMQFFRQPVHTVYGGAHLFKADSAVKLGGLAMKAFVDNAPDADVFGEILDLRPELSDLIYERVYEKLEREAVEDLRIDFEDGYGIRSDAEEDGHAVAAATEMAKGMAAGSLPPFIGFRIKGFTADSLLRGLRTLDLFLTALADAADRLPENFVVTLPKVSSGVQVTALADALDELEMKLGFPYGTIKIEIMIETPQAIIAPHGRVVMLDLVDAARGRCRGAHFGAYDYTAGLSITSTDQDILHQSCDFARNVMQVSLAGTGVWLSDGATNILPVGPYRKDRLTDDQVRMNRDAILRAWRLHYYHCRSSLGNGYFQGWDLHPAQLPTRYAAVYAVFLEEVASAGRRLVNFVEKAARASLVGDVFDDAATGQGLLNFFVRAINCGALTEDDARVHTGLSLEQLRTGTFPHVMASGTER
jgi:citrate lyase beta subunit